MIAFPGKTAPLAGPVTLKIVTYNIQDILIVGHDRAKRMRALGKTLSELDPDIVGFQEAFVTRDRNILIDSLAQSRLKFHKYFPSRAVGSGLLISSAYPIQETSFHCYAASNPWYKIWEGDWWAGKGAALTRIELPDGKGYIHIFNTHAQAGYKNPAYDKIRFRQMNELADFMNSSRIEAIPAFLVGDLNCGEKSEEYKLVAGEANLIRLLTIPSYIDHIFAIENPRYSFEVSSSVAIAKRDGLRLSDHNGYMLTVYIIPR